MVLWAGDAATSARSEPVPESPQLVTEKVAALAVTAGSTATEKVAMPTTRVVTPIRRTAPEMPGRDLVLGLIAMLLCFTGSPEDPRGNPRSHSQQGLLSLRPADVRSTRTTLP